MNHDTAGARTDGDDALVRRIAAGDQRALGMLWDRHGATAYALACTVTAVPSAAERVLADAFAQLWRDAPTFDPNRMSVFAWLTSVVRTHALAARRRDLAVPHVLAKEPRPSDRPPTSIDSPHRAWIGASTLDALQARAVELAFFGGMTKREIAAELHLTEGSVAQLLRRAVEALGAAEPRDGTRTSSSTPGLTYLNTPPR